MNEKHGELMFDCQHRFHADCAGQWIARAGKVCPMCKTGESEAMARLIQEREEQERQRPVVGQELVQRRQQEEYLRELDRSRLRIEIGNGATLQNERPCCFGVCNWICSFFFPRIVYARHEREGSISFPNPYPSHPSAGRYEREGSILRRLQQGVRGKRKRV